MPPTSSTSMAFSAIHALSRRTASSRTPFNPNRPSLFLPASIRTPLPPFRAFHMPSPLLPPASSQSSSQSPSRRPSQLQTQIPSTNPSPPKTHPQHKRQPIPPPPNPPKPEYEMTFTCTPCSTRSTHRVSKQGYHHGSVLITCPECRNRHIISDHLNIFGDRHVTIEDLMRERGQLVKRGTLSEDGDVEFWEDGTQTERVRTPPAIAKNTEGKTEKVEEGKQTVYGESFGR